MRKLFLCIGVVAPLLAACTSAAPVTLPDREETPPPAQGIVFMETEFDFGIIKQSGGKVQHDFAFTYNGETPAEITGVPTSCACTSATASPVMLQPGDRGVVTVIFNPNLHAEPEGRFFKTAMLLTNPPLPSPPEVKIWAQVDLDLGPEAFELGADHEEKDEGKEETYRSVMPERFADMLREKDFFLVDVHIPEQEHIGGTDLVVPYNEIEANIGKFPQDKNAKIVLYCRSGGMSRAAASALAEHGYTNVFDLTGGKNAYDALGETQDLSGETQAKYIEAAATLVTASNAAELSREIGEALPQDAPVTDGTSTVLLLSLNNHQENLAAYDYGALASLDGAKALQWLPVSNATGGHHIAGLLTFPKQGTPQILTVSGLPVGDIVITLSPKPS